MKVVLDTNIWVSSLLLPQSIPSRIVAAWQRVQFDVVVSDYILNEIKKVLNYPKIQKRLAFTTADIDEYITLIRFFAEVVELNQDNEMNLSQILRDVNDVPVLATLLMSKADYLVTGDKDLLILKSHYAVITPSEFAKFLD